MDKFFAKKAVSTSGAASSVQINTSSGKGADTEMIDESKPKFTPWVEK